MTIILSFYYRQLTCFNLSILFWINNENIFNIDRWINKKFILKIKDTKYEIICSYVNQIIGNQEKNSWLRFTFLVSWIPQTLDRNMFLNVPYEKDGYILQKYVFLCHLWKNGYNG